MAIEYTYNDVTKNIKEWADEYNIGYQTLRFRLQVLHWDIERALTAEIDRGGHAKLYTDEVTRKSKTIAEWAHDSALPGSTIRDRITRGWSVHDAVTRPRQATPEDKYKRMTEYRLALSYNSLEVIHKRLLGFKPQNRNTRARIDQLAHEMDIIRKLLTSGK